MTKSDEIHSLRSITSKYSVKVLTLHFSFIFQYFSSKWIIKFEYKLKLLSQIL